MALRDMLKATLGEELFQQVDTKAGEDFDWNYVAKGKMDEVVTQRNNLKKALRDVEHADEASIKAAITKELEAAHKKEIDAAVGQVRLEHSALQALTEAGALDSELMFNSGLHKDVLGEDGSGVADWIKKLQEDKPNLFAVQDKGGSGTPPPGGTGKAGQGTPPTVTDLAGFMLLSADDQITFKNDNPELFQSLMPTY